MSLLQKCNDTRTNLYQNLLREHRKLKTEHQKVRVGVKDHMNKLIQDKKDLEGKCLPRLSPSVFFTGLTCHWLIWQLRYRRWLLRNKSC